MIGGSASFNDYEMADAALLNSVDCPTIVVRPTALSDDPPNGKYEATTVSVPFYYKFIWQKLLYHNLLKIYNAM